MHAHSAAATARPRLVIALVLSATVFVVEAVAAAFASSLALFAEAFHVLIDVVALAIAVVAVWLAARPTSERRTFGMLRLERSEERRVGEEGRSRWSPYHLK